MGGRLIGGETFKQIAQGLRPHPLYLLIFALIFIDLIFCVYAFAVGDAQLRLLTAGGFILLGAVAFAVIRSIELNTNQANNLQQQLTAQAGRVEKLNEDLERADRLDVNLSDPQIEKFFVSAISNVRKSLEYKNSTFHDEIATSVETLVKETESWSNGYLLTDSFNYEQILLKFYRSAVQSVFATSNEHYLTHWKDNELSKRILDAHKAAYENNRAKVTGIFVFSSARGLECNCLDMIAKQDKLPFVTARVLITEDHDKLKLPPNLINDFVIIDQGLPSEAIGIESSIDLSSVGAKWIFSGDPKIERTARWMDQVSISFEELRERRA